MPSRILTYAHRYKRPPRKWKAVVLEVPAIVRSGRKRKEVPKPAPAANDDRKPIVTAPSNLGRHGFQGPAAARADVQRAAVAPFGPASLYRWRTHNKNCAPGGCPLWVDSGPYPRERSARYGARAGPICGARTGFAIP